MRKNIIEFMEMGDWAVESIPMPLTHSFGLARLRCLIEVGGTAILEKGLLHPDQLIERMKRHGIRSLPTPGDQADPDAVAADVHVDGDSLSELHGSGGAC